MYGGVVVATVVVFGALLLRGERSTSNHAFDKQPAKDSLVQTTLKAMSLREKVASMFVFHAPGTNAGELQRFVSTYNPGGFILMSDNIPATDSELRSLTGALRGEDKKLPRLVAIDQEGGAVSRLKNDTFASAEALRSQPVDATRQAFKARSELLQSVGITANFGIVADVTNDPSSFMYGRVLGTTPQDAAERAAAAVDAAKGGTLSTLKHFPGHGRVAGDSHVLVPTTPVRFEEWQAADALPFNAGVEAGADMVMFGHLRYDVVDTQPASLSKKWHEILRSDVGYDDVTITDDMFMLQDSGEPAYQDPVKNAVDAVVAGNSMLLYVLNNDDARQTRLDPNILIDGVMTAVESGKISESVVTENAKQVLELRRRAADFLQ